MRKKSNLRTSDEKIENIINKFIEQYFYNTKTEKYIINKDKNLQFAGIDVIFILDDFQYNCDEKVAAHYINKPLTTFAFELSFIDRANNVKDGWLIDKTKLNNSYLLCWIDEALVDKPTSVSEIIKAELILITKEKLLHYLETMNWTIDLLKLKSKNIRENKSNNLGNIKVNGLKFSYSEHLVEKPINVIITREKLREISTINNIINPCQYP